MRRALIVLALGLLVVTLVRADHAPGEKGEVDLFHRNRELIETLVETSLRLSGEDDPLLRADCYAEMAECLADEIRESLQQEEDVRAEELGTHLHDLFEQGVSPNLRRAHQGIPAGSAEERKMQEIGQRATRALGTVKNELQAGTGDDDHPGRQRTLRQLRQIQLPIAPASQAQKDMPQPAQQSTER